MAPDLLRDDASLFFTGVTGFVGAALLLELLRRRTSYRAFCLVRGDDADHGQRRVTAALRSAAEAYDVSGADLESVLTRVTAVRGDLLEPGLGICRADHQRLQEAGPLVVWHCAASLKESEQALSEIIAHNVKGTERMLETVLEHNIAVFNHVSTAYVAGRTVSVVEEALGRPRGFNNRYEQSKFYGEMMVVDHCERAGVPYRILRPAIVVSHSETGRATGYTGFLGTVLKIAALNDISGGGFAQRPLQLVAEASAQLNVIPIDSVVEDCIGIDGAGAATLGRVFHLTNRSAPTMRFLCGVVVDTLSLAPIEFVATGAGIDPLSRKIYRMTGFERPYCLQGKVFSRVASNKLYSSPRHGFCPITAEQLGLMVSCAVADYRAQRHMQANARRGAA